MFVLYKPLVFLHVLFGFLYMLAHGASAAVAYRLRHETSLERVRALLDLSRSSFGVMYLSLLVMLVAGIVLGFLGHFWTTGWIWVSLILLIALILFMTFVASREFNAVRRAAGLSYFDGRKEQPAVAPAPPADLQATLRSSRAHLLTAVGVGAWTLILWFMIYKPF